MDHGTLAAAVVRLESTMSDNIVLDNNMGFRHLWLTEDRKGLALWVALWLAWIALRWYTVTWHWLAWIALRWCAVTWHWLTWIALGWSAVSLRSALRRVLWLHNRVFIII